MDPVLCRPAFMHQVRPFINHSINVFHVLGGNWDPTDKKFSSVNSCRQEMLSFVMSHDQNGLRPQVLATVGRVCAV